MYKFGLIGEKLPHSKSPEMHAEIMKENKIEGTYDLIEIPKDRFEEYFTALKDAGYHGLNVTIPYKETIIPYLDELSPQAKYIGAVNTIAFRAGRLIGHNTDYFGFQELLLKNDVPVKGKEAIVLGSGGAAKAVTKVLLDLGIFDLTIVSRGKQNFHGLYTVSYDYFKEGGRKCDLLINCTPVGMFPHSEASPLPKEYIRADYAVDLIYNPIETLFLKYAKEQGSHVLNGIQMLWEQAVKAEQIWLEAVNSTNQI